MSVWERTAELAGRVAEWSARIVGWNARTADPGWWEPVAGYALITALFAAAGWLLVVFIPARIRNRNRRQ